MPGLFVCDTIKTERKRDTRLTQTNWNMDSQSLKALRVHVLWVCLGDLKQHKMKNLFFLWKKVIE